MTKRNQTDRAGDFAALLRVLAPDLPGPVREYRFHPERKWRFDLAWTDERVAVEVDGGVWLARGGRHGRDADREKLNAAAALGWRVLRFSTSMIDSDPAGCVWTVTEALKHAWQGVSEALEDA